MGNFCKVRLTERARIKGLIRKYYKKKGGGDLHLIVKACSNTYFMSFESAFILFSISCFPNTF